MSTTTMMTRALHHYMVKSSAGVYQARLVVPMCDWPRILHDKDDDNDEIDDGYETLSATVEGGAGRTRIGVGVVVTELAGPRNANRVLCVMAHTSTVFVNVLHRLLIGLAGGKETLITRLLVNDSDFELACHGRGGIRAAVAELQRSASVHIALPFERFYTFPLAGETAIRMVGRPEAVVHCVCLINELLCVSATASATRLIHANRRPSRREDAITYWPASTSRPNNLSWSVFAPLGNQYRASSSTATTSYCPPTDSEPTTPVCCASLADQYSPLSPTDSCPSTVDPRAATPVWSASECPPDRYSPQSNIDTDSDWSAADPRPATPIRNASGRLPDRYSPQSPTDTTTNSPAADRGSTTPTGTWEDLFMNHRTSSSRRVTFDDITTTITTRPTNSVNGGTHSIMHRFPALRITTNNTTATYRHGNPITNVSNGLIVNRPPIPSRYPPNATRATYRNGRLISIPYNNRSTINRPPTPSPSTANSTTATYQHGNHIRSFSNELTVIRLPSHLPWENTNATYRNGDPLWNISNRQTLNQPPTPSNFTTNATTATTSTTVSTTSINGQPRDSSRTVIFPKMGPL